MSEVATIVELRRLRPVKWSAIEKKIQPYRDGYVKTFLSYEGRPIVNEDGSPVLNGKGHHTEVTAAWFARNAGIPKTTFNRWLFDQRGYSEYGKSRVTTGVGYDVPEHAPGPTVDPGALCAVQRHGQCDHCPEWKE